MGAAFAREPILMTKPIAGRALPALALVLTLAATPAAAGYEDFDAGASLSGSYLAGRFAGKLRDMDVAARYFSRRCTTIPTIRF